MAEREVVVLVEGVRFTPSSYSLLQSNNVLSRRIEYTMCSILSKSYAFGKSEIKKTMLNLFFGCSEIKTQKVNQLTKISGLISDIVKISETISACLKKEEK